MNAPPIRAYETKTLSAPRSHESSAILRPVPWHDIFGNDNPVEVEIGCGRGRFLVGAAQRNPAHNYFGLERRDSVVAHAQRRLEAACLENARALCCDARCVIGNLIPDHSVYAYHLYFPDPWWKRRHHKRRIHEGSFPLALRRTVLPRGHVYVATDVPELLVTLGDRFRKIGFHETRFADTEITTSFAARCLADERRIHRAAFTLATPHS